MAYELTIDKLYPEGERYSGKAERFDAFLKGPPEQITSGIFDDIIAKVIEWFPPQGADKLIRIRIWRDITPWWATLYKVEVIGHSSPISWVAIAVALAAIIGIAVISWSWSHTDWKAATLPLTALGVGLALLVLAVMVGKPARRKE